MTQDDEDSHTEQEDDEQNNTDIQAEESVQAGLILIDPKKLKPNSVNVDVYGKEGVDEELLNSIREKGQLEPIVIGADQVIISGHRRWCALKEINNELKIKNEEERKAICIVKRFASELDEKEAIVEANTQREKTALQIYREAKLLKDIYAERAKRRQMASLQPNSVVLNSVQREESGRTNDILARKTGVKRDKLQKIMRIGEAYDTGDTYAIEAMNLLNIGESTVDATIKKLDILDISKSNKPEAKFASTLLSKMNSTENDAITPSQANKKINDYIKNSNKPKSMIPKLPEGIYNVIVANPPSINAAMNQPTITDAKDAACFLWSKTKNLKETMDLMATWGFTLESIAIWDREQPGRGMWFDGVVEFLLLGIKGDMEVQKENKLSIIFKAHKNIGCFGKDEWPKDFVYDMAETMFPNQQYLDPYNANGREGWYQPTIPEINNVETITNNVEPTANNVESTGNKVESAGLDDWLTG